MMSAHKWIVVLLALVATDGFAFEHAKVLPKGVRKVTIRQVDVNVKDKTNRYEQQESIVKPLEKNLTFGDITKSYSDLQLKQLQAFLIANGFGEDESVGQFKADFSGKINVTAPILAWGITDRLTLGVAVPFYNAKTDVTVGFVPSERAQQFLNTLSDPYTNQVAKAREAGAKLNNAVGELNNKLAANDYAELGEWKATGLGDTTMVAKLLAVDHRYVRIAGTGGFVAPTGRVDDPNILTDIGFGDGQWDATAGFATDFIFSQWVYMNQYVTYVNQMPGSKTVRMKTADEPLEVPNQKVKFKLGDRVESGVSLQYDGYEGIFAGVGYNQVYKYGDRYYVSDEYIDSKDTLQEDTVSMSSDAEFGVGYSSINAFKRGNTPVPLEATLGVRRHLKSSNTPIRDMAQLDLAIYF